MALSATTMTMAAGVNYTATTDSSTDWSAVTNNSYFYDTATPNYPSGYVYEPHHSIKIRVFSDYLEFGNPEDVDNIPNYAWFSTYENTFFWKDLYTYGYIDGDGLGVDYPFINGSHYPFQDILLLQKPIQRTTKVNTTLINNLTNDNCE